MSKTDVFVITPDQKAKYESQFVRICSSRSDFMSGEQAKTVMLSSGLPPNVLAHIWSLADVDSDGRMDINEFSIALHLISLKLKGVELPQTLPQSLKVWTISQLIQLFVNSFNKFHVPFVQVLAVPPTFAAFSDFGAFGSTGSPIGSSSVPSQSSTYTAPLMGPSVGVMPSSVPPPRPAPPMTSAVDSSKTIQRSGSITSGDYPNSMLLTEWAIPQPSKLKYTQQFNSHDRTRTGFLTGPQARNILIQSKLPQPVLAQIWNLADIDADGRLTCDEFVVAMHLIDCVRAGDPVPTVLPPDLIPPSYRRKRSLSGSAAVPTAASAMAPAVEQIPEEAPGFVASFEDKRRENFEKGQAELDRRRHALLEQQKREREERERKEREEQHKREQIRFEFLVFFQLI
jgi:Ca2+-binding EF-hand superfamily protein